MKQNIPVILSVCISVLFASCGDSGSSTENKTVNPGDPCSKAEDCPDMTCAHGICMDNNDPCVNLTCDEGVLCRDGKCQDSDLCGKEKCTDKQVCKNDKCVDLCGTKVCKDSEICKDARCHASCGGKVCESDEKCISEQCVKTGDCGGLACKDDEVCVGNVCIPKGDCGGIACGDDETCLYDVCHKAGDCGGLTCLDNEVCHEDKCYPKGDCGGIECQGGQVCDIYNDVCRDPGTCGDVDCGELYYCLDAVCVPKEFCNGVYCDGGDICENDVCVPGPVCIDTGKDKCGTECCTDSQFCGSNVHCCEITESCGNDCCSNGEICINEICHIACADNIARCTLDDGTEVCCNEGEICTSNKCFAPKVSCVDNYMCENSEYCETTENICLPRPSTKVCESKPTGGDVQPTLKWYWGGDGNVPDADHFPNHLNVMSSPMVADVDEDGMPNVVFNSWPIESYNYNGHGILRILDGETGKLLHSSNGNPFTDGGSQTAIGRLYPPDVTEVNGVSVKGLQIVTCVKDGNYRIAAYNAQAELIWESTNTSFNECGQSGPAIADFNGDGYPEVYSRYNVYNGQTGEIIARRSCGDTGYQHIMCDYSVAAMLKKPVIDESNPLNSTVLQLVGGNVAFDVDFVNKKLVPVYERTDQPDGYPSIADLDLEPTKTENGDEYYPEIVVVRSEVQSAAALKPYSHTVMAFRADGTDYWEKPVDANVGLTGERGGGPATIANVLNVEGEDKQYPEVTLAGGYAYVVFDHLGNHKWHNPTQDRSSRKTGSSVFDFDGDGKAEIVYGDELFLRVYDGQTGETRFCQCNVSATHWEYPVIADVNKDGHAEIIVSSNRYFETTNCPTTLSVNDGLDSCVQKLLDAGGDALKGTHGVRAFASPNDDWVNTRKIYNQHAYSVTNVSDDGTIPRIPRSNWTIENLNNFRLNVQPGASYLPDLEIRNISSPRTCEDLVPIYFDIVNVGWAAAKEGITIHIWASSEENGEYHEIGTVQTKDVLRAGDSVSLKFDYPKNSVNSPINYIQFRFDDSMPEECNTENNSASYKLDCTTIN
ncbi:MAG: VCBS repeat-containing protein [Proteobacteria bacterium]|nr:VCBS repeat-containing protein [Pseudomonadota bacterium]